MHPFATGTEFTVNTKVMQAAQLHFLAHIGHMKHLTTLHSTKLHTGIESNDMVTTITTKKGHYNIINATMLLNYSLSVKLIAFSQIFAPSNCLPKYSLQ